MNDESGILLTECARLNPKLKKISVERNPIGYRIITELNKALEANILIASQKRHIDYSKKRTDLQRYDGQKESVMLETVELESRERNAKVELEQQK